MPRSTGSAPTGVAFRRSLTATIVLLALVCAVFAVLGSLTGPRLSDASVDTRAVTDSPAQTLRLFANQAVAEVDDDEVEVRPAAPFTVSTDRDIISIRFDAPLASATRYEVTVRGVTSPSTDVASELRYEFETDPAEFVYLDRADPTTDPDGQDAIILASATEAERTPLLRATRIQDYAVFDNLIAVATLEDESTSAITLVDPDGVTERLELPARGTIDLMQGSAATGRLGFTFTSESNGGEEPEYVQSLFSVDLAGDHRVRPVLGLDGEPIEVLAWQLVPGTSTAVLQNIDQSVLRVDLAGDQPTLPLGQFLELGRVSPDGATVAVSTLAGLFSLPLDGGEPTPLPLAPVNGVEPFGGDVQLLGRGVERLQQVAIFDEPTERFSSHLVYQDASDARVLYEKTNQRGSIESFAVSANGQYATVTTVPDVAASVIDGYAIDPASTSVTTLILDVATGAVLGSVDGFDVRWQ